MPLEGAVGGESEADTAKTSSEVVTEQEGGEEEVKVFAKGKAPSPATDPEATIVKKVSSCLF